MYITFIQRRHNVCDFGPTLYKSDINVLCLLGSSLRILFCVHGIVKYLFHTLRKLSRAAGDYLVCPRRRLCFVILRRFYLIYAVRCVVNFRICMLLALTRICVVHIDREARRNVQNLKFVYRFQTTNTNHPQRNRIE